MKKSLILAVALASLGLAGCAAYDPYYDSYAYSSSSYMVAPSYYSYGYRSPRYRYYGYSSDYR